MDTPAPIELPPRLEDALQRLADPGFAERLRKVYQAAAHAIGRLSDLDLVRYESHAEEAGTDLSLWEEMAPVIRDTVIDVNGLLAELRAEFPEGSDLSAPPDEGAAIRALHDGARDISGSLGRVAEMMRDPSVMADRWNLLAELQAVRSRLREELGGLVFDSASFFADLRRRDVVPGYLAELRSAVTLRAFSSDLQRVIAARMDRVRDADTTDIASNANQLQNELDTFGRTAAYRSLRAQDKRHIVEFRSRVGTLASEPTLSRGRLMLCVQELHEFVVDLQGVNQRPILQEHDHEVMAHASMKLEQASQLLDFDPATGALALADALASSQSLYGRQPELDVFLRRHRKVDASNLSQAEAQACCEELLVLIAGLHAS